MSDGTRRDFIKAGVAGAALLTYVAPTIETFMIADAWAKDKDKDVKEWEGHDRGRRRRPTPKKKKWWKMTPSPRGGGDGLEMEWSDDW